MLNSSGSNNGGSNGKIMKSDAAQSNTFSISYHSLDKEDDESSERQFSQDSQVTNVKGILIAFVMFILGIVLIVVGVLLIAGISEKKHTFKAWTCFIIGILVFLPGVYHVRIAFLAWRRTRGYSYDDIPSYC